MRRVNLAGQRVISPRAVAGMNVSSPAPVPQHHPRCAGPRHGKFSRRLEVRGMVWHCCIGSPARREWRTVGRREEHGHGLRLFPSRDGRQDGLPEKTPRLRGCEVSIAQRGELSSMAPSRRRDGCLQPPHPRLEHPRQLRDRSCALAAPRRHGLLGRDFVCGHAGPLAGGGVKFHHDLPDRRMRDAA